MEDDDDDDEMLLAHANAEVEIPLVKAALVMDLELIGVEMVVDAGVNAETVMPDMVAVETRYANAMLDGFILIFYYCDAIAIAIALDYAVVDTVAVNYMIQFVLPIV